MLYPKLLTLAVLAALAVSIGMTSTHAADGDVSTTSGNASVTTKLYKFDDGFYQRIQGMMEQQAATRGSDARAHGGTYYHNTIIVVSKDDGSGIGSDETASENKADVVKMLKLAGAHNITAAESLSFVTADVPVEAIPGLTVHDEVYRLGDGELRVVPEVNTARTTTHATPAEIRAASGSGLSGSGITVGVIDNFVGNYPAFTNRINHVSCTTTGCNTDPEFSVPNPEHATYVAQILAASGYSENGGFAPGVNILSLRTGHLHSPVSAMMHALDYASSNNVKVVNISSRIERNLGDNTVMLCGTDDTFTSSTDLIMDEAIDRNMVVVKSAGNQGLSGYGTITNPGCGHNVITVGGINDRSSPITMDASSSKGPVGASAPTLKPEIVAPSVNIQVIETYLPLSTTTVTGTSFAAPQVSAASALLLQYRSDFTPVEVKAALLIGADWQGPMPCTATDYERNDINSKCSHGYESTSAGPTTGSDALGILNNVGFGILNVSKSLEYSNSSKSHIISHEGESIFYPDQTYRINATQSDQVKVIMSWLVHPRGSITNPLLPIALSTAEQYHNYNIAVVFPNGTRINSNSAVQTNEFVVFEAPETGHYVIIVSSANSLTTKLYEPYAIASTHQIEKGPFTAEPNTPPTISLSATNLQPSSGDTVKITADVYDQDGDDVAVRWHVIQEDIDITLIRTSGDRASLLPVPYHDTTTSAVFKINATATDYKQSTQDQITIIATITDAPRPISRITETFETPAPDTLDLDGWVIAASHEQTSGLRSSNMVLTSNNCDSQCVATFNPNLDTSSPLTIEFDRFVDRHVDDEEGLYVQYSTDGTNWTTLASYTEDNNQDTDEWGDTSLTLDITQSTASLRFVAESSRTSEFVEIDNVSISPKAADTVAPTITVPPDRTFEATGALTPLTAAQIGTATATDDTDSNPTVTNDALLSFPLGTTTVTWTATDSSDNVATATQTVTVQDTTPPEITVPDDVSLTTTDASITLTESDYGTTNATDLVDPTPTITNNATNPFLIGNTTILWTATDRYQNSANDTQLVTVIHSSLAITAPPDVTVEATGPTMVIDIGTANATHDTDTYLTISNDAPESFSVGTTTTVTWKVVDSSEVTATDIQLVTVQDTTPPAFGSTPDLDFVFDPDTPIIINYDSPTATDAVDDAVEVSCTPASGSTFGEGATTVTCTATDDYSNSADVTFDVNVRVYDTTVFSDGFEGRVHDSWDSPQFSFWSTDYNVPVTVPGHDSSNKIAHAAGCDFAGGCVMELTDGLDLSNHTDPEFLKFYRYLDTRLDPGDYLKLEAYDGSAWAELGRWNPENSEDDGAWHLEEYDLANYTDSSGFKLRFTAVAGAGIDEFGVDDVLVYKVPEVASNGTALAITAPADIVAEATGTLTAVDIGTATATGGFGNVTISHEPQAPFPLGNTTVTWTVLDSNGTSATDTQLVTVQDTTAPTVASITRSDPAGGATNSTSLIFAVTFSEDVTGVDVSDFALSPNSTGGGASATGQFAQTSEPALPIPDRSTIRDAITVGQSGNATSVSVAVDVTHTYIGDLKIDIIAPDGTTRTLHDRTGYETDDIDQTYAPDFAGVSIAGDWTLRVRDGAGGDTGTLNGWTLTINRDATATNPVTSVSGSGSTYDVTVSVTQDGTYNLDLVSSGHGITDGVGNPLSDAAPTGVDETYTVSAN